MPLKFGQSPGFGIGGYTGNIYSVLCSDAGSNAVQVIVVRKCANHINSHHRSEQVSGEVLHDERASTRYKNLYPSDGQPLIVALQHDFNNLCKIDCQQRPRRVVIL